MLAGGIDDEGDGISIVDRALGLRGDLCRHALDLAIPATRVDQDEALAVPFSLIGHPVARDTGDVLHYCLTPTDDAIDQSGLAHVGTTHHSQHRPAVLAALVGQIGKIVVEFTELGTSGLQGPFEGGEILAFLSFAVEILFENEVVVVSIDCNPGVAHLLLTLVLGLRIRASLSHLLSNLLDGCERTWIAVDCNLDRCFEHDTDTRSGLGRVGPHSAARAPDPDRHNHGPTGSHQVAQGRLLPHKSDCSARIQRGYGLLSGAEAEAIQPDVPGHDLRAADEHLVELTRDDQLCRTRCHCLQSRTRQQLIAFDVKDDWPARGDERLT